MGSGFVKVGVWVIFDVSVFLIFGKSYFDQKRSARK